MLGSEFVRFLDKDYELILPTQKECDIAELPEVKQYIKKGIDLVINCAAISNIDYCEKNPKQAVKTNFLGPANLLKICQQKNVPLMHFGSTQDKDLINVYAVTKYLSVKLFNKKIYKKFFVFRTDLLFGGGKHKDKNFVGFLLKSLKTGHRIELTNNRYSSPTYIKDLIDFCWKKYQNKQFGIYEVGNQGRVTRWQLANEIANILGKKHKFFINNNFKEIAPRVKDSSIKTKHLRSYKLALKEYIHESYL